MWAHVSTITGLLTWLPQLAFPVLRSLLGCLIMLYRNPPVTSTGSHLRMLCTRVVPAIADLINWYDLMVRTDAAAVPLGFTCAMELNQLQLLGPSLGIVAARWLWQCGDAELAQQHSSLEATNSGLSGMRRGVARDSPGRVPRHVWEDLVWGGLLPPDEGPIDALDAFLLQEKAQQQPGSGMGCQLVVRAACHSTATGACSRSHRVHTRR
jgi:hypothetical protein